ncbi:hypothetical protein EJB05_40701, partial [Eragrostis curvula]
MASPPPPPLTVGDLNARSNAPRCVMWAVALYLPSASIAVAAFVAYCMYNTDSVFPGTDVVPAAWWQLPPVMLWGVYMAVVSALVMYTHLFQPRAPAAVHEALVDVGMCWVGVPLSWVAVLVACLGSLWMDAALSCFMVALIAAVVAFGVRLDRSQRGGGRYGQARHALGTEPGLLLRV